jgi:hypothetical protein
VLCAFDACPDLAGVHAALQAWPEQFRGLGVPLGTGRTDMQVAVDAQLDAGFSGLRLTDADVLERPWLLQTLARRGRIALVCGRPSAPGTASALLAHLERNADAIVVGGHFGGADDPRMLDSGPAAELFSHPRFSVVFSRHGGYPAGIVESWAAAVVAKTGWRRIMWGSEAPVLFWRNETIGSAIDWVDRLSPTAAERADFFAGNTQRLYFDSPIKVGALNMPFDPWKQARPAPAVVWASGLPVDQEVAGRLVHGWIAAGGSGSLRDYANEILAAALPPLPG